MSCDGQKAKLAHSWQVRLYRQAKLIGSCEVPAHKIGTRDLQALLKALVAHELSESVRDIVSHYINGRKGTPNKLYCTEIYAHLDRASNEVGYWCGKLNCYALAVQKVDRDVISSLPKPNH